MSAASVRTRYEALVQSGAIEADAAQLAVVEKLDGLAVALAEAGRSRSASPFAWLFGAKVEPAPRGLYVWGAVGRGKTMLMDLFFEAVPATGKRRVHFHAFMADVHARIHAWRQALKRGQVSGDDPIRPVAAALAEEAGLLCFDEFAVIDIADAMILGRLFKALFAEGVVVVATSNAPPDELYKEGLNRALFVPFIRLLQDRMEVVRLEARTDFRMEKIGETPVYFTPDDAAAAEAVGALFRRLTGGAPARPATLTVLGRELAIPAQAMGVARFTFAELCGAPLAAADYLALARAYHTVVLEHVPRLRAEQRNEARRFITLIDVLYERNVKLIASAEAEPGGLYEGATGQETFEFARTVSRLHEMASRDYLARPSGRGETVSGEVSGLAET